MIRKFSNEDGDKCRQIIRECFEKSVTMEERMKRCIKDKLTSDGWQERKANIKSIFVYEKDDIVIGMGCLDKNEIEKVYVMPEMQGKGIGSEIMSYLESLAEEKGCSELTLNALPNAVEFYIKKGYMKTGVHYYGYPEVRIPCTIMKKKLTV